jgi:hypothetical protein
MHYRSEAAGDRFYIQIDGPLPMMQASVPVLAAVLPPFSEGRSDPGHRQKGIRLAEGLLRRHWRGVLAIGAMVFDVTGQMAGTPNSFFFDTRSCEPRIEDRLWSLSMTLVAYENGHVGVPQMLEELHTALEWTMKNLIGPPAKKLSYAEMVQELNSRGAISDEHAVQIVTMKGLRVGAKHRGKDVDRGEFNKCLHPCLEAVHVLVRSLA